MAKNYHGAGDVLPFTAAADLTSGQGLLLEDTFGVVAGTYANGDTAAQLHLTGVWELPKKTADVLARGDKVYWDDTAKEITLTATSNKLVGFAWEAASGSVSLVKVRLIPNAG